VSSSVVGIGQEILQTVDDFDQVLGDRREVLEELPV